MTSIVRPGAGRYAPSPSGDLHVGNLRTALLAWLFARKAGLDFFIRVEDLDERTSKEKASRQLADLEAIGLDWDGEVIYQSERRHVYAEIVHELCVDDRVYECFCSRKDIHEAARAPHAPEGAYPGTCRNLTPSERAERRRVRPPALRFRSEVKEFTVFDEVRGDFTGIVDDFVVLRGDGTPAYNLAVVVDDALQGVTHVVRGDDLLASSPRQAYLATHLGYGVPTYCHVPLVLNENHVRLAKRDGAVTLADLRQLNYSAADVRAAIGRSLNMVAPGERPSAHDLLGRFDPHGVPRQPWVIDGSGAWLDEERSFPA